MNKLKKVFAGIGVFLAGLWTKVFAWSSINAVETKYGVADRMMVEEKYGVFEPTLGEKISSIGKIAIPIILFAIGLFVILSKKIAKKVKAIIILILVIIALAGVFILKNIG